MMRLKSSGFAGPIAGLESGTTDCAAAPPAEASDSSARRKNTRLSIMQGGEGPPASTWIGFVRAYNCCTPPSPQKARPDIKVSIAVRRLELGRALVFAAAVCGGRWNPGARAWRDAVHAR